MLTWATETTLIRPNLRQVVFIVLKWVSLITIVCIILFFTLFGIDLNLHVTLREPFSSPMRPDPGPLSSNCFKDYIPESSQTQHFGIIPSIPVIEDNLCYDFVSLIKPTTKNLTTTTFFHTTWTSKTSKFSDIELATLRSFIATQPFESVIYIWTTSNDHNALKPWIHDDRIQIQLIDNQELIQNTPFTDSYWLILHPLLLKFVTLFKFGGVWFDLNTLFIRDMSPLLSQEWISQSNCLETSPKGFFLHFFKNSPYLCEIMTEANNQLTNHRSSLSFDLYKTVFHRLLKLGIRTWSVLPWCYTDPSQCLKSNSLPSAFDRSEFDIKKLNNIFVYHLHKSWNSSPGTIFKYLVNQHKKLVSW